jgi:hypothetical protein
MGVSKNELPKYQADWLEVQGCSTYRYGLKVLERLGLTNDPAGKNLRKVHNVYSGILKDREVLDAIRSVLLASKSIEKVGSKRQNVMAK